MRKKTKFIGNSGLIDIPRYETKDFPVFPGAIGSD